MATAITRHTATSRYLNNPELKHNQSTASIKIPKSHKTHFTWRANKIELIVAAKPAINAAEPHAIVKFRFPVKLGPNDRFVNAINPIYMKIKPPTRKPVIKNRVKNLFTIWASLALTYAEISEFFSRGTKLSTNNTHPVTAKDPPKKIRPCVYAIRPKLIKRPQAGMANGTHTIPSFKADRAVDFSSISRTGKRRAAGGRFRAGRRAQD
jgi:hypothetical protein